MILLSVRDLIRQFDAEPVFEQVTFDIRAGEKVGLVGPNGVGKSTLLKILAGLDEADAGKVEFHPTCRYALLEQHPVFEEGSTLLGEARKGLGELYALQHEGEQLAHQIAHAENDADRQRSQKRFDIVMADMHRLNAYNLDHRVDEVLRGLGFQPEQYDHPVNQLSGGQKNRLLLARLLLSRPNLMLLDEPTNHLDISATEWLEQFLANSDQAMIIVSHDRYFLDKVTNRILEIQRRRMTDYPGNFSAYWRQREERMVLQQKLYEKQQAEIADLQDFIRKNEYGQKSNQANDREKKLARMELIEKPMETVSEVPMGFGQASRTGDCVIEGIDLSQGFGSNVLFENLEVRVIREDRLAIFGPNGCGKTTLLRTILGELPPRHGSVRFGAGVQIGYFDQQLKSVPEEDNLIEAIRPPGRPEITPAQLRDQLARFGLRGDIVHQSVSSLSGGERNKVALARLSMLKINVLILDEPTNHLDFWACASLEQALKQFEGTIVFVSHDRYFIDRLATRVMTFDGPRVKIYDGNYSAWLDMLRRRAEEAGTTAARGVSEEKEDRRSGSKPAKRKRQFPYRTVDDIEQEIAAKESELADLQTKMGDPDVLRDGARIKKIMQDSEELKQQLAQLYEHWEEAVELNG
ncbi:MAG: ABC-F family ATP-binding cassette domain-containing protein [Planctomycetales bacterium]